MKHSEAEKYIRNAFWCVQHLRSIAEEDLIQGDKAMRKAVQGTIPWVFSDDKTLLHPLTKIVERLDNGGKVSGMEFYNIMTAIHRFAEVINLKLMFSTHGDDKFPEPKMEWVLGWDEE